MELRKKENLTSWVFQDKINETKPRRCLEIFVKAVDFGPNIGHHFVYNIENV